MQDVEGQIKYHKRKDSPYYRQYGPVEDSPYYGKVEPSSTRQAAELRLMYEADPSLADRAVGFYDLGAKAGQRAHRGALIALKGDVYPHGDGYRVRSQTYSDREYFVYHDGIHWRCQCEDYQYGGGWSSSSAPAVELGGVLQVLCKHICAVLLETDVDVLSKRPRTEWEEEV